MSITVSELQQFEQPRANFLNMIAHDMRIPLTTILGHAEFVAEGAGGALSPQQHESVRGII